MKNELINLQNIYFKVEDQEVLKSISFKIRSGDYIGLFGPNGAGKTTLIKILLGLIKPTHGYIQHSTHMRIGYVPQKQNNEIFFPGSVSEILQTKNDTDLNIIFNLSDIKDKLFSKLSGGQKQKVIITLSVLNNPDLLILDEPTNGLDSTSQNKMFEYLRSINLLGTAIIFISHDIDMVVKEVKQVLCLNKELTKDCPIVDFNESDIENLYGHNFKKIEHTHTIS